MKIKKSKRLLALILCMALVLGTNTFTMAADASQSQEEIVQDESTSQEGTGTEEVQTQGLEETEETVTEPTQEQTEEPGQEEIQGQTEGETTTENMGEAEETAETPESTEPMGENSGSIGDVTMEGIVETPEPMKSAEENDESAGDMTAEETVETEEDILDPETDMVEWSTEAQSFTNTFDNITVFLNAQAETLPVNAEITIERSELGEEAIDAAFADSLTNKKIYNMDIYDIKMLCDGSEKDLQEGKALELQFDVSDKSENTELSVYYIHDNVAEMLEPSFKENGTIKAGINQFGTYAVVETKDIQAYNAPGNYWDAGPLVDLSQFNKISSANALMASTTAEEDSDGVFLDKSATYDEQTNKIKIQLESYITGSVKGNAKPIDIVLILDQSGSMEEDFSEISYADLNVEVYEAVGNGVYSYQPRNSWGEYTLLHDDRGWFFYNRWDKQYISESSGGRITITRQGALIDILATTGGFIDTIVDEAQKNKVTYRVGAIAFTARGNGSSNAEIISVTNGFQEIIGHSEEIKNGIKALEPDFGTWPSGAFEKAESWFERYSNEGTQKVAVFFTDGEPGGGNGVEWDEAGPTINTAKSMKATGVTIYSVGIFDGADANNTNSASNRFMHGVSSNYPNATATTGWSGYNGVELGDRYTTEDDEQPDYYLTAGDAGGLEDIFDAIADEMQPSIDLGANTVVKDTVTDQFTIPEGTEGIKCYTSEYLGNDSWADKVLVNDLTPVVSENTVTVTGFNFTENMVADRDLNGEPTGKKLIVEFYIEPKEDFIGGNAVITNGDDSGIYQNAQSQEAVDEFIPQKVNVPIVYKYDSHDDSIYIGDTWSDVVRFFDNRTEDGIQYKKSSSKEYTIDGINNEYVTIEYTVKQGDETIGVYTITPGATTGAWTQGPNIDTSSLTECTDYTVNVNVTSKNEPVTGEGKGDAARNITDQIPDNGQPTLHVFVPEIAAEDKTVYLGDVVNLSDCYTSKENVNWVESITDNGAAPQGQKPDLTITPEYVSGTKPETGASYYPEMDSDFKLKIERAMSGGSKKDITTNTKFNLTEKICKDEGCYIPSTAGADAHHFTIHVVAGSIEITKEIEKKGNAAIEGDPIFTFKIVYEPFADTAPDSPFATEKTFYRTIRFTSADPDEKDAEILEGLPKGIYTVTELTTQKYSVKTVSTGQSNCKVVDETLNDRTVEFHLGKNSSDTGSTKAVLGKVRYVNEKTGPSTNTDTDTVVNRFEYKDGKWTISQIPIPGTPGSGN